MYELIRISDITYYILCPARMGLVSLGGNEVALIDSGNDKQAGRKVRQILDAHGWKLRAIYNTHSHADHIGGNKYLQNRTGCRIYAPGIDSAFTRYPVLEPSFLYGGCPPADLRHKFLMAEESDVTCLTREALPEGFEIIDLPGHSFDMVGYRTPDDTVFLADCLSSRETLDKYGIGYIYDVGKYLDTLKMVMTLSATMFVPAHAEASESIAELARANIDKVLEIAEIIIDLCREPISFEMILRGLFDAYGLHMDFEQYVLVGSTVRSYLAWLKDSGRLGVVYRDNMLLWERVPGSGA